MSVTPGIIKSFVNKSFMNKEKTCRICIIHHNAAGFFMKLLKSKKIKLLLTVGFVILAAIIAKQSSTYVINSGSVSSSKHIVIDAGHGGSDSGKVGVNQALEKDINLAIANDLKELLTDAGFTVTMTRETTEDLASENASNRKVEDMRKRCEIIADAKPVFTISIHQNSYTDPSIKGAQVFYYTSSDTGKQLAETLQAVLKEKLDPSNNRQAKANDTYYMLKRSDSPTVIVECGFLSNPEEADLLSTDEYQQKVAAAILEGIKAFLNSSSESASSDTSQ